MTPNNRGDEALRAQIQEALNELKKASISSSSVNQKLDEVARKQDGLPQMFSDLERRQQQALDALRRDFERMFVPRTEYDPKHKILEDRMLVYDKLIEASKADRDDFVMIKNLVKQHDEDIDGLRDKPAELYTKVLSGLAVLGSIIALALNLVQHVQIR